MKYEFDKRFLEHYARHGHVSIPIRDLGLFTNPGSFEPIEFYLDKRVEIDLRPLQSIDQLAFYWRNRANRYQSASPSRIVLAGSKAVSESKIIMPRKKYKFVPGLDQLVVGLVKKSSISNRKNVGVTYQFEQVYS